MTRRVSKKVRLRMTAGCAALAALGTPALPSLAQQEAPQGPASAWLQAATAQEAASVQQTGTYFLRYREHKIDAKGDTVRAVIVSKDGAVARLLERNGKPLSPTEDAAERARLQSDLDRPEEFIAHHRHDAANRADMVQVIKLLPQAMLCEYAPGQPQLPGIAARQVVLDFHPDPAFHPHSMYAEVLTGVAGRVWIDAATQHMLKVEARVLKPVNLGFGVVAHIFPGGTVELDQQQAEGHWVYAHMEEHLGLRVAVVKTLQENVRISSYDFHATNATVSFQDAVRELLAIDVSAHP